MTQGQGRGTANKEVAFALLFRMSLRISKSPRVLRYPYWHIDLNAGSGWNDDVGCEGSPLVFLREAYASERAFHAHFCDANEAAVTALRGGCLALGPPPEGSIVSASAMDNSLYLEQMTSIIQGEERRPALAIGSCLCDPNGFRDMPIEALSRFADCFPRIDLILNINCNLFRSAEGCKRSTKLPKATVDAFRAWPTVRDIVNRLGRGHWMVRNPPKVRGPAPPPLPAEPAPPSPGRPSGPPA